MNLPKIIDPSLFTVEEKSEIVDALVEKFKHKGRLIGTKRITKEIVTGPYEATIYCDDIPVYEFVLRINGHNDITKALLALLTEKGDEDK